MRVQGSLSEERKQICYFGDMLAEMEKLCSKSVPSQTNVTKVLSPHPSLLHRNPYPLDIAFPLEHHTAWESKKCTVMLADAFCPTSVPAESPFPRSTCWKELLPATCNFRAVHPRGASGKNPRRKDDLMSCQWDKALKTKPSAHTQVSIIALHRLCLVSL